MSLPRFIPVGGGRELVTFPAIEQQVLTASGATAIDRKKPNPILIPPEGYVPNNEEEAELLKGHSAFGTTFKAIEPEEQEVIEQAQAQQAEGNPAEAPQASEAQEAATPTSEEPAEEPTSSYDDVASKVEAAEILTAEPYNIPTEALKSDAGNLTKDNIRGVADQLGISFPNL